ncbi:hypothetical protein BOTBODRAFT_31273 [Botryobasidium botryosum FD-172 SS1]|uniref:Peptidase A2 domain-containing protein n=1 Tax=Botryobasidium botryosum (strain FD-172 SS1) TaxID=930990 RepID=A0A067MVB0_BOTB1|nr:hypothetical protein BOTBODRAFT_31273 [Botryobasidium botryosum FD-172 SS1]
MAADVAYGLPADPQIRSSYEFHLGDLSRGGLHIYASIGGGDLKRFRVDTGSEGILVASQFVGQDCEITEEKFCLEYTSSKNFYSGRWVIVPVALAASRSPGAIVATTDRMKVRMVEKWRPHGGVPITDPSKIKVIMLGVGFDRDTSSGAKDPCDYPIPTDINPFLRLTEMVSGTMTPGYILTPQSITLGITTQNSARFDFVKLDPLGSGWAAPSVYIAVPTANIMITRASLLIDTGLSYSIVQAPSGVAPPLVRVNGPDGKSRMQVADGQEFVLTIAGLSKPMYTFKTGSQNAPAYVSWRHHLHNGVAFINTSMHALSEFDYMYDYKAGRLGFRFHT